MKKSNAKNLAKKLGLPTSRGIEAIFKAELISAILKNIKKKEFTHIELAERSGIPRSAVTGILSGSLQKVSIERVLRLAEAVGLNVELKIKTA